MAVGARRVPPCPPKGVSQTPWRLPALHSLFGGRGKRDNGVPGAAKNTGDDAWLFDNWIGRFALRCTLVSSPRKRGPSKRERLGYIVRSRRTGSPAFAGDDSGASASANYPKAARRSRYHPARRPSGGARAGGPAGGV